MHFKYVIYKITFPNGKIYIGKDVGGAGHSLRYFGSWDNEAVSKDFKKKDLSSLTLTKDILFESTNKAEVSKKEAEFILKYGANKPDIGYNKWPKK
jgi:hypothetical protein